MDRRSVVSGLAAVAAVAIVAGQVLAWLSVSLPWRDVMPSAAVLLVAPAIPLVGGSLVARRRPAGVAVLVGAALIGLPAIVLSGSLLASSSTQGDQATGLLPYLAGQLFIVAAGAAAWGLREADRWRWNRSVPSPFVAVGIVALLPAGQLLVTMHGVLFPLAMFADLNLVDLALLAQFVVAAGLLAWAARLPRRTAAVVVLVLVVPRLLESLAMFWRGPGWGGFMTDPLAWLGLAAEVALIGTACWWLTREDDLPVGDDVVDPGAQFTR